MIQHFPRVTPPHLPSLADALATILTGAGYQLAYDAGAVRINFPDFAGKGPQVQAAVDAAPAYSDSVHNKWAADNIAAPGSGIGDEVAKQGLLTLLDLLNVERGQHGRAAITPQQFVTEVKKRL